MFAKKCLPPVARSVVLLAATLGLSGAASAALITFDGLADGTVINSYYSGVTFNNPLPASTNFTDPPNIFARSSSTNASPGNVVSVFGTGVPAFDARWGAVEAVFSSGQRHVSIDAAILRVPEGLGSPTNMPKLEIYDLLGAFVTSVTWDFSVIPQPGAGGITGFETLGYTSGADDIGKVRFLSGQPGGAPSNFGIFDNLAYSRGGGTIPEPGSMALLGLGLAALVAAGARRKI